MRIINSIILFKVTLGIVIFVLLLILSEASSIEEIKSTFGSNLCIRGSVSSISTKAKEIETTTIEKSSTPLNNVSAADYDSSKSFMSKVHELAQFNEVDYFYKLVKEEGPPHNRLFTVSLTLGDEEFISEGSSLKKAQQNVALIALENTQYQAPPVTEKFENDDTTTPTVLLNNLCVKLGIPVEYFLVNKDILDSNIDNGKTKKSYLQKLNDSIVSDIHIRKDEAQTKGPFKVRVDVGDLFFYGMSHTIQSARHEAASKAIDHLIKVVQDGNSVCLQDGSEDECNQAKATLKSPISAVHEAAQLRNLHVEFEIISESGPPHKKVFVTKCTLGHLSTTGEGKSKKESKKAAAIDMLERMSELPEVSQEMQVKSMINNKNTKKKKKKKNKILKSNFDVINMHVENFINSVKDYELPFNNNQDPPKSKNLKHDKRKHLRKSYQDGILELSNLLKFEVQFTDFNENQEFYVLMSLYINPEYICLGQGSSSNMARDKAANAGLKLLQNIDLGKHFKNEKITFMESEIKQKIRILLNEEISEVQT